MADRNFTVRQQRAAETAETADRFYFEILEPGKHQVPSILCEVRRCGSGEEFEIIVWKGDTVLVAGEKIPRKALADLARAIEAIL